MPRPASEFIANPAGRSDAGTTVVGGVLVDAQSSETKQIRQAQAPVLMDLASTQRSLGTLAGMSRDSHFIVMRLSTFGSTSMDTSLYSSNKPLLCICQAMGPVWPASGTLKSRTSTALLPMGCATAMRATPLVASTRISTRLHWWGSNLECGREVNSP